MGGKWAQLLSPPGAAQALLDAYGAPTHIWLSLGANDLRDSQDFAGASKCLQRVVQSLLQLLQVWRLALLAVLASTRGCHFRGLGP